MQMIRRHLVSSTGRCRHNELAPECVDPRLLKVDPCMLSELVSCSRMSTIGPNALVEADFN